MSTKRDIYRAHLDAVAAAATDGDGDWSVSAAEQVLSDVILDLLHPADGSPALITEEQLLAATKRVCP